MVKSEDFDSRADLAERFGGGQMTVGEGQMVFWEVTNCQKKKILSMQSHRHNVKTLHCLEGCQIMVSEPL